MTAVDERTTATGPTLGSTARAVRGPLIAVAVIVALATVLGLLSLTGPSGRLDPESFSPGGSRALAQLLRDSGVEVRRVDTVDAVAAADAGNATVLLPVPGALAPSELEQLAELDATLVVVGADDEELDALDVPAETRGSVEVAQRRPACELPAATTAGDVDIGGTTYRGTDGARALGCYAAGGDATLLVLPDRRVALLGDGLPLTNGGLDDRGNAALAVGLLARPGGTVLWLVPRPGRAVEGETESLGDLLPPGLLLGLVQVAVALVVLALWRARRLGRVVEEPLPVVVRAAEAVEGRGRLYRAAGARGSAAEALRAATRDRLARTLRVPVGDGRGALVGVVAARTGSEPGQVDALLYGEPPVDDDALVRLAGDLRALEDDLARSA